MKVLFTLKCHYNIYIILYYIMGGVFSNSVEQNALYFELDDTIVKEGDTNIFEIDLGKINEQKSINGCGEPQNSSVGIEKYSGGVNKLDLHELVVDGECDEDLYNRKDYFSTCFMTPKDINLRGVDNPENCKIVYKAELKCDEEVVETFENKQGEDNNLNFIILLIILLVLICFLKK